MPVMGISQSISSSHGAKIFKQTCMNCHGVNGASSGAPILFGQEPGYLKKALTDFKEGVRKDMFMGIMNTVAKDLSANDIAEVSEYLASVDPCLHPQDIDTSRSGYKDEFLAGMNLADEHKCINCHGTFQHGAPKLFGQKELYLRKTLNAFKLGTRKDPYMEIQLTKLKTDDFAKIALYLNGMRLMRFCK